MNRMGVCISSPQKPFNVFILFLQTTFVDHLIDLMKRGNFNDFEEKLLFRVTIK